MQCQSGLPAGFPRALDIFILDTIQGKKYNPCQCILKLELIRYESKVIIAKRFCHNV